ncbi:MAG TPA: ATP-binding protein, partial [Candidatus Limnocylindrales bacterium]|nr:ATP-binding protein [Candidatus Limnocylindrales bacterium]
MSRSSQPSLDIDVTRSRLERLGMVHACEQLEAMLADAVKAELAPHRFLDQVLESELAWREERRVRTSLRLSGLPTGQTIGSFDFSFQPSIERSRIETLGTCQW